MLLLYVAMHIFLWVFVYFRTSMVQFLEVQGAVSTNMIFTYQTKTLHFQNVCFFVSVCMFVVVVFKFVVVAFTELRHQ